MLNEADGNVYALANHLAGEEQYEREAEYYINSIQSDLDEIQEIIDRLRDSAKDYENYDMSEELQIALKEII